MKKMILMMTMTFVTALSIQTAFAGEKTGWCQVSFVNEKGHYVEVRHNEAVTLAECVKFSKEVYAKEKPTAYSVDFSPRK